MRSAREAAVSSKTFLECSTFATYRHRIDAGVPRSKKTRGSNNEKSARQTVRREETFANERDRTDRHNE
jgi:hypothetical protein